MVRCREKNKSQTWGDFRQKFSHLLERHSTSIAEKSTRKNLPLDFENKCMIAHTRYCLGGYDCLAIMTDVPHIVLAHRLGVNVDLLLPRVELPPVRAAGISTSAISGATAL